MISSQFLILRPEFEQFQGGQEPQSQVPVKGRRSGATQTHTEETQPGTKEQTPGKAPAPCDNSLWMIVAMVGVLYFVMIRPQQKQEKTRRALLASVKKNDKVVTSSGMHGSITQLTDNEVTLRVDKDIKLTFDRSAIARKLSDEPGANPK